MEYDYAKDIPFGRKNAISRERLRALWGMSDRDMRDTIAWLREHDPNDDYIIISRSEAPGGYYRSDDPEEIRLYMGETKRRAIHTFKPLKKARRVLAKLEERH